MSEEKTEQEIISDEIAKAQKAMFLLKKHTKYADAINQPVNEHFYLFRYTESFEDVIAPIQRYLKNSYDRLMKGNKKVKTSEFRPIRMKNLQDKKQKINSVKKGKTMAAKKATKKKAPVKKAPVKKMGKK